MDIEEVKVISEAYVDKPIVAFTIEKTLFDNADGREKFNQKIRDKVSKKFGVYVWVNNTTGEIVYIGMAGAIKTDGTPVEHSVQERLLASRGKDKISKKDIQTNDYVKKVMTDNNIDTLNFYILYSKPGEPPAYIESLLLYSYYKKNNRLPKLNSSF